MKGPGTSKKLTSSTKKATSLTEDSLSAPKSTQKEKKAAARAVIRETRAAAKNNAEQQKKHLTQIEDDASDLDYGSEDNDDSDEDYNEKPWAMKKAVDLGKESSKITSSQKNADDMEEVHDKDEDNPRVVPRTFTEAEYEDYKNVTIPRRRLIRWCHEPFFEKAIQNYYVRVTIGRDPASQKPLYKLSKILDIVVKENEEYDFPAEPGKLPVRG